MLKVAFEKKIIVKITEGSKVFEQPYLGPKVDAACWEVPENLRKKFRIEALWSGDLIQIYKEETASISS